MTVGPSIERARDPGSRSSDVRDWIALTASGVAVALLGLLWTLSASRFLSPAEYADFTAGASLIYFAAMALGPLSQTIAWFTAVRTARGESPGNSIRAAGRVILALCGAGLLVMAVVSPFASRLFNFRSPLALFVSAVAASILALSAVRRGFIQGSARFSLYSASVAFEAVLRLSLLFLAFSIARDAASSLATYVVAAAIAMLLLPVAKPAGETDLQSLFRFFTLSFLATAIYSAFLNSDVLLVKLFFEPEQAAVYGASSFIAKGVGMLVAPFYVYAVPHLAGIGDPMERRRRFARLCLGFLALEVIAVLALFALRRPIVAILLGPPYARAADLILLISVAVVIGGLTFVATQLPASRERFDFVPWYAAGFVIELVAVALWHDTLAHVIVSIIGAQIVTLILLSPKIVRSLARDSYT